MFVHSWMFLEFPILLWLQGYIYIYVSVRKAEGNALIS